MSRSLLRSALELRSPITRLPPTFLLPIRARWISSTPSQQVLAAATMPSIPPASPSGPSPSLEASCAQQTSASIHAKKTHTPPAKAAVSAAASAAAAAAAAAATATTSSSASSTTQPKRPSQPTTRMAPSQPPPAPTGPIPASIKAMLPLLRAQPNHYITIHVHGRPYLVTQGDSIRLPFLMPGVAPGDVLRLNRASVLGSRDLTLRPSHPEQRKAGTHEVAYIDERLFECRATVVGVDSEPMRLKEKTKRRNRKVKTVRSKHRFTVVTISELRIRDPAEIEE